MKNCFIIGAGPRALHPFEKKDGDLIIAADGGYGALEKMDLYPDYVIGDFDSSDCVPPHPNTIVLPKEKDDTDMLAAIRLGFMQGCDTFYLYNGMGGRIDHSLANIQCLALIKNHQANGFLFEENQKITLIHNERVILLGEKGIVSVFAFGGTAHGVTLDGLYYPLSDADVSSDYPIGVSNEFPGGKASVEVKNGYLMLICPVQYECVFEAL